jgi:hypothetical protein
MTMHLVRGLSSLNTKKRKASNSKKLEKSRAEHEEWLRSKGVGKTALPVNKRGKRVGIYEIPDYSTGDRKTSDRVAANGTAKERMVYSGERTLLGVAVMHKSNLVPIFADKKQDAKDIAQMRRN